MDGLTIAVAPDELTGLTALAALTPGSNAESLAMDLLHGAIVAKLDEAGLPWPPPVEPTAASTNQLRRQRIKRVVAIALAVVAVVVLWGGYVQDWSWTGFPDNKQLWDWLSLLLLPIVFATIPLWLRRSSQVTRTRRVVFLGLLAAFVVFVLLGYLLPIGWTGFTGNKLWDWLVLVLLPVTLVVITTWSTTGRTITTWHRVISAALAAAWLITVLGGYEWGWSWTGYEGNTLWDWLQLVLLPLVVPTLLVPAALELMSQGAPEPRRVDERQPVTDQPDHQAARA